MHPLYLLSGGAAHGLVAKLEERFALETGCRIKGTYSAVGLMREQLLNGAPCDVVILTAALIAQLETSGDVVVGSARRLGSVKTGIAVKTGAPAPAVATVDELKLALLKASGIYFPDPFKSTAGIHFMGMLKQLSIEFELAARLRPFANGATAMNEMAKSDESSLIGCTQITEILYTPGVCLVAPLPKAFELTTVYSAVMSRSSHRSREVNLLTALLCSPETAALRRAVGFED
jgi:molybdate transport system substrate-binding protein